MHERISVRSYCVSYSIFYIIEQVTETITYCIFLTPFLQSDIGFGKLETYVKLGKLGEVSLFPATIHILCCVGTINVYYIAYTDNIS